jgi:putative nucleotidyltransferase with HDIG domain
MNAVNETRTVLFVVDAAGLARNASLIGAFGGRYVMADRLAAEMIGGGHALAIDVDLTAAGNVNRLRAALAGRRHGYFQVFAVDVGRRLEVVYANILGASELARRPLQRAELEARLAAFRVSRSRPANDGATESSIGTAADAIGGMFTALTSGQAIDFRSVAAASDEVAEAISSVGFPTWVDTVRQHHEGTFQHCLIVTGLASAFGHATGMSRRDVATLTCAGLLHDIGKAAVPVAILDKPGKLTPGEIEVIRTHPARGFDHLAGQPEIDGDVLAAVRGHHEYLDGSGYPDGIAGGKIGDITRILTICDVFGALIERRSYKPPSSTEQALAVLEEMVASGKLEAPLVRAFQHAVAA